MIELFTCNPIIYQRYLKLILTKLNKLTATSEKWLQNSTSKSLKLTILYFFVWIEANVKLRQANPLSGICNINFCLPICTTKQRLPRDWFCYSIVTHSYINSHITILRLVSKIIQRCTEKTALSNTDSTHARFKNKNLLFDTDNNISQHHTRKELNVHKIVFQ